MQSFIFRVLKRTGYSDFSTVLTNGGWGDKPNIPYQARSEFETFNPNDLFVLYEKNKYVNRTYFSSPFSLKSLFIDVFYPEKQKSYSGQHVQIRYYQKCIEKQLYNLGYAYFKADWLKSSGCHIHNEQLNVVENRLSLNETSEAIKNSLTGKGSVAGSLVSWKTVEHDNSPFSRVDLYFAVCAKDTISDYIFFNEELCPHDYIDLIPTGLLKKENSNHSTWGAK
ncbi:hypothetical protein [Photorhabdus laumondii]